MSADRQECVSEGETLRARIQDILRPAGWTLEEWVPWVLRGLEQGAHHTGAHGDALKILVESRARQLLTTSATGSPQHHGSIGEVA